jgi:hypothetical protein
MTLDKAAFGASDGIGGEPKRILAFLNARSSSLGTRAYWREVFARQICHIEIEPQSDCPLEADATMLGMSGLNAGWCHSGSPAC